jgi:hypothetical protein
MDAQDLKHLDTRTDTQNRPWSGTLADLQPESEAWLSKKIEWSILFEVNRTLDAER